MLIGPLLCPFKEVETEAMEEADSIPEVGDIMGLETTIAAGKHGESRLQSSNC